MGRSRGSKMGTSKIPQKRKKTNKDLSRVQEDHIAQFYGGTRSPSSGASPDDQGDVRFTIRGFDYTGECKVTRADSIGLKLSVWDKISEEANSQGRRPTVFLRFDRPGNRPLDLVIRDINDDMEMILGYLDDIEESEEALMREYDRGKQDGYDEGYDLGYSAGYGDAEIDAQYE